MSDLELSSDQLELEYYIRNREMFAGRNVRENRSLLPKEVTCPTDHPNDPQSWKIEQLPNGRFRLSARGAPTGIDSDIDNRLLFAFLDRDASEAEEWIITFRQLDNKNRKLFTIEKANKSGGWIRRDRKPNGDPNPQIAVGRLTGGPKDAFGVNELWNIQASI